MNNLPPEIAAKTVKYNKIANEQHSYYCVWRSYCQHIKLASLILIVFAYFGDFKEELMVLFHWYALVVVFDAAWLIRICALIRKAARIEEELAAFHYLNGTLDKPQSYGNIEKCDTHQH